MDADELSRLTADPLQVLGMSFYFDPGTKARGRELGLNVVEFYGLGRAGTMGDVDVDDVFQAFTFFSPSAIEAIWTTAKTKASPVAAAALHLQSAYEFADRTFGAVPLGTLAAFADAARKVVDAHPRGSCPLVDGYRQFAVSANPVHAAYLGTILLRELRGGLHIQAVTQVGLDPLAACFLQDEGLFALHGYNADEAPVVTDELRARKVRAEELTDLAMAKCFEVLGDPERTALAEGARALFDALSAPVPVAG